MTLVVISRTLNVELGDQNAQDLANDFRDYKSGDISFGAIFGRDRPLIRPNEITAEQLQHVHLEDSACSAAWDEITDNYYRKKFSQDNYTSNTILVYGQLYDVKDTPFLLHAILKPLGHALMDDVPFMRELAAEFREERRTYAAHLTYPTPLRWVIART